MRLRLAAAACGRSMNQALVSKKRFHVVLFPLSWASHPAGGWGQAPDISERMHSLQCSLLIFLSYFENYHQHQAAPPLQAHRGKGGLAPPKIFARLNETACLKETSLEHANFPFFKMFSFNVKIVLFSDKNLKCSRCLSLRTH